MTQRGHYSIDLVKKYKNFIVSPKQDWVAGRPYSPDVEKKIWEKFFIPLLYSCDIALVNYRRAKKNDVVQEKRNFEEDFDFERLRKFSYLKDGIWFLRRDFFESDGDYKFLMDGILCKELVKNDWRIFGLSCCFLRRIEDFPLGPLFELIKIDNGHFFPGVVNNFFSGSVGRGYKNISNKLNDDVVMISWLNDFRSIYFSGKGVVFESFFENILFEAIDRGLID